MKQLSRIEIIIGCLLVLGVYGLVGNNDYHDQKAAEQHAKHAMQLAQRDEAERKAEFDYLAKKATYMTGFAAVTGK
jgi:hypothetical protein